MPLEYSISQDGREVHITGDGPIGIQDCMDLFKRIRIDPGRRKGCSVLIDLQHANCMSLHEDNIAEVMKIVGHGRTAPYGNMAVVARGATLLHAELLASQLRIRSEISIQVFVDINAAKAYCASMPVLASTPAENPH